MVSVSVLTSSKDIENLQCTQCCLEDYIVCGKSLDCLPESTYILVVTVACIALVLFIMTVWCLVQQFYVGRNLRRRIAYKVVERDAFNNEKEKRIGVILNLNV